MPLLLIGILLWFLIFFIRNKKDAIIREQALIIEKQTALQHERTRIASEMHDDLGGGLTTINFLSQKLIRNMQDDQEKASLEKIVNQSQTLVTNMSEIIWAMNAGFDTLDNLVAYTRRYAREYLDTHDIKLHFHVEGDITDIELTGEKRRSIFLVIKEALHNTVKHSQATEFSILFDVTSTLNIVLGDNGVGLPKETRINGNGLRNMEKRVTALGGQFFIKDTSIGTTFQLSILLIE